MSKDRATHWQLATTNVHVGYVISDPPAYHPNYGNDYVRFDAVYATDGVIVDCCCWVKNTTSGPITTSLEVYKARRAAAITREITSLRQQMKQMHTLLRNENANLAVINEL